MKSENRNTQLEKIESQIREATKDLSTYDALKIGINTNQLKKIKGATLPVILRLLNRAGYTFKIVKLKSTRIY